MEIIKMTQEHYHEVFEMMKIFYSSDAVYTNGSDEIFERDIQACISDHPYVEGYVFINEKIIGYAMLAKSYSTEFAKQCIWLEDLYIKEAYRHQGIGSMMIQYIHTLYPDAIIRLEVEDENEYAIKAYKKNGFTFLPYKQMKK